MPSREDFSRIFGLSMYRGSKKKDEQACKDTKNSSHSGKKNRTRIGKATADGATEAVDQTCAKELGKL